MVSEFLEIVDEEELMRRGVKKRETGRYRISLTLRKMPLTSYIKAFCLIVILGPKACSGLARLRNQSIFLQDGSGVVESLPAVIVAKEGERGSSGEFSDVITPENTGGTVFDPSGLRKEEGETRQHHFLSHYQGSPASLNELASRAKEILDRISKNWVLEGAKAIQTGEIRLRKLNKDLTDRIEELAFNGSKYGKHVLECMKRSTFEMELDRILDETNECYSESLISVQAELKKIEEEQKAVLKRMDSYGKKIFEMLSTCFFNEDTPSVIECLQKVDSVHVGIQMREVDSTKLTLEMARIVNDIPRTFSECTTKGLAKTEAHLRKGYAQSLTCLKETIT